MLVEGRVATRHGYPLRTEQSVQACWAPQASVAGGRALEILYKGDGLLVTNKPTGLLSITNEEGKERTMYRQMTKRVHQNGLDARVLIAHRLDRDTSGVLLAARTAEIKYALQDQWEALVKTRAYTAVVEGCPQPLSGRIHTWLYETKNMMVYSSEQGDDGLEAVTDYKVIGISPEYPLVNIRLQSGRENQIHVHMTGKGCPVMGGKKYGAKSNPLKRLGLHAGVLELCHPEIEKLLWFEAKMPAMFLSISFQHTNIK